MAARVTQGEPLFDFTALDGVQHTIWQVTGADRDALVAGVRADSGALHRRRSSSCRQRRARPHRDAGPPASRPRNLGDGADFNTVLAVAFPHDQVQILAYNRVVKDLGGPDAEAVPRVR